MAHASANRAEALEVGWAVGAVASRPRFRRPPPNRAYRFSSTRLSSSHSGMLRGLVGSPHVAYLQAPASSYLTPFALWTAFPPSDYYEVSVAMGPPLVETLTP